MNAAAMEVRAFLDAQGIAYRLYQHAPAAHMDECAAISAQIGVPIPKNYFLSTRNEKAFALCIVRPDARLRTADVSKQAGLARLGFAGEDKLETLLHARAGSVNPFSLLYDREGRIRLLIDEEVLLWPRMGFHPCDNRFTVVLEREDFLRFCRAISHEPMPVTVRALPDDAPKGETDR